MNNKIQSKRSIPDSFFKILCILACTAIRRIIEGIVINGARPAAFSSFLSIPLESVSPNIFFGTAESTTGSESRMTKQKCLIDRDEGPLIIAHAKRVKKSRNDKSLVSNGWLRCKAVDSR